MNPNFNYQPILIERSEDFWALFDEMVDDQCSFLHNRSTILDSFKNKNLYGLILEENDYLWNNRNQLNPIDNQLFCRDRISSLYLFPLFCIKENNNECLFIWNHSRNRRKGLAKKLVQLLKIEKIWNPLQDSLPFWESCGI
jgi:hypothetical protein